MDTVGTRIMDDERHVLYSVEWSLVRCLLKPWSGNREPDMERVREIHEALEAGVFVPKMLLVADAGSDGLLCYDGNHRREAFNMYANGDRPLTVVVDILRSAAHRDIVACFRNVNKSISVPEVFLTDEVEGGSGGVGQGAVKEALRALVREYETTYKPFLSASARCHAPHFNRDAFMDALFTIYTSQNGHYNVSEIQAALRVVNERYKDGMWGRPHEEFRAAVREKCQKHGMWLFAERGLSREHVLKALEDM